MIMNILIKIGTVCVTLLLTPLLMAGKVFDWTGNFYVVLWDFIRGKK